MWNIYLTLQMPLLSFLFSEIEEKHNNYNGGEKTIINIHVCLCVYIMDIKII